MNLKRTKLSVAAFCLLVFLSLGTTKTCQATDLSGCWSGRWQSCTTGHEGPLRADFCRISESQYRATFSGRFFKILPFRYSVVLDVVQDDGQTVTLQGSSYLGRVFGTFCYQATANECTFSASYTSKKDQGLWVMSR